MPGFAVNLGHGDPGVASVIVPQPFAISQPHRELRVRREGHGEIAGRRRSHAPEVRGALVGIVGHRERARSQPRLEQCENARIGDFGAVEEDEIDRSGQVARERLARVALADLGELRAYGRTCARRPPVRPWPSRETRRDKSRVGRP